MVLFTMSLMIGTAGLPHVIIRFFTVPKVADARWSAGWALVFIALLYTVAPAVGCDGAAEHHHHHLPGRHRTAEADRL
jgi:Na+(H+)/acetate symporter ActP